METWRNFRDTVRCSNVIKNEHEVVGGDNKDNSSTDPPDSGRMEKVIASGTRPQIEAVESQVSDKARKKAGF